MALVEEGYKKCGEVFTVPVFHWKITFLVGPDVSPHFYKGSDEDVSQKEVKEETAGSAVCIICMYRFRKVDASDSVYH